MDTNMDHDKVTKTIGGQIPEEVYWEFKKVVADRKETMQQALLNAIMLYIEFNPEEQER